MCKEKDLNPLPTDETTEQLEVILGMEVMNEATKLTTASIAKLIRIRHSVLLIQQSWGISLPLDPVILLGLVVCLKELEPQLRKVVGHATSGDDSAVLKRNGTYDLAAKIKDLMS